VLPSVIGPIGSAVGLASIAAYVVYGNVNVVFTQTLRCPSDGMGGDPMFPGLRAGPFPLRPRRARRYVLRRVLNPIPSR
jgi:hypothetical protein